MSVVAPIQHDIPKNNNYKNINITNFKGTSYSDNLFDGKSTGCSESENIYVNEQNILAVRPRLEHKRDFENIQELYDVFQISKDITLYYGTDNDGHDIIVEINKNKEKPVISYIEKDVLGKCSFFMDGTGKIICASEKGLYVYTSDTSDILIPIDEKLEDTYIPLSKINMEFGNENSGISTGESPNILHNTYKRSYSYNLNSTKNIDRDYTSNRSFDTEEIANLGLISNDDLSAKSSIPEYTHNWRNQEVVFFNTTSTDRKAYSIITNFDSDPSRAIQYIRYNNKDSDYYFQQKATYRSFTSFQDVLMGRLNPANNITDDVIAYSSTWPWVSSQNIRSPGTTVWWLSDMYLHLNKTDGKISSAEITLPLAALDYYKPMDSDGNAMIGQINIVLKFTDVDYSFINCLNQANLERDIHGRNWLYFDENDNAYVGVFFCIGPPDGERTYNYAAVKKISKSDLEQDLDDLGSYTVTYSADLYRLNLSLTGGTPVVSHCFNDGDTMYTILQQDDSSDTSELKVHIISTDLSTERTGSVTTNLMVLNDSDLFCPAVHGVPISKTKLLLFTTIDSSLTTHRDTYHRLVLDSLPKMSNIVTIVDITTGEYSTYNDDQLANNFIYKLPNTTSFLALDAKADDITDGTQVSVVSKLFTNYNGNSSGYFKLPDLSLKTKDKYIVAGTRETYVTKNLDIVNVDFEIFNNSGISTIHNIHTIRRYAHITSEIDYTKSAISELVQYNKFKQLDYTRVKLIDNRLWFYGSNSDKNKLRWTLNSSAFYIPEDFYTEIGKYESITDIIPLTTDSIAVFQQDATTVLLEDANGSYSKQRTLKTPKGSIGEDQVVVIPTTNIPMVINDDSVAVLTQGENGVVEDSVFTIISEDIFEKFASIPNKKNIKTHTHGYYVYLYWSNDDNKTTNIWCLDSRTNSWFYWTVPIIVKNMYEADESSNMGDETETRLVTNDSEYAFTTVNFEKDENDDTIFNEQIEAYVDKTKGNEFRRIPWKWKSRVQTLGTVNYLKKIISLQLIFSDKTRKQKNEGVFDKNNSMFFNIKTYRKKSKLLSGNFSTYLDGVGIQRIKVRLPKCDFAEICLSNYSTETGQFDQPLMFCNGQLSLLTNDSEDVMILDDYSKIYNTFDRLHLIGITLKILLSEGLNG